MRHMKFEIVKTLAVLFAITLLGAPAAQAILCNEYLRSAGAPTIAPILTELGPEELGALTKPRILVSEKPFLRITDDKILATFRNLPASEPQVVGIQASRPYYRPDLHEIQGFMKHTAKDADTQPVKTLFHPTSRYLSYGMIESGSPRTIKLEYDEIIAAVTRLNDKARLVATIRKERAIGFARNGKGENFLIEIYHFEESGYSVLGVRIPATEQLPVIKMERQEEAGYLLTAGAQTFKLSLMALTR